MIMFQLDLWFGPNDLVFYVVSCIFLLSTYGAKQKSKYFPITVTPSGRADIIAGL